MAEDNITINIDVKTSGIGVLNWNTSTNTAGLTRALSVVGDEAIVAQGVRRLEASVPSTDRVARRALLRSGFRQEGIRRQAWQLPSGEFDDVILFARLASDETAGENAFSAAMNSALPRKRLIAHVAIRDEVGRFLLCRTTFKPDWELPGGIVEPFESPRDGARREVLEELGVDRAVGPLLIVDWMPPYLGWDDALELIYDGGTVTEAQVAGFHLDGREIAEVQLLTLDEAAEVVTPLSHRRLTTIAGLAEGTVSHSEDGRPS